MLVASVFDQARRFSTVEALNDTADLYRYFDCTEAAEFLYGCVAHAIDDDLPREIDFLRRNDEAKRLHQQTRP